MTEATETPETETPETKPLTAGEKAKIIGVNSGIWVIANMVGEAVAEVVVGTLDGL